ncbi:RNA polymerase sigma-28 factor [Bacillus paralicheniformis]|nr:RNA polymerase sigma-28 factor [Bacillus paralicheniformis]
MLKSENEDVIDTIQLNLELDKIKRHVNILDEREKQVIFGRFGLNFFKKKHKKKLQRNSGSHAVMFLGLKNAL